LAPDLLTRIRGELEERMTALRPLLDEYHRLLAAAESLALVEAEMATSGAREDNGPARVGRRARNPPNSTTGRRARTAPEGAGGLESPAGEPDNGAEGIRSGADEASPIGVQAASTDAPRRAGLLSPSRGVSRERLRRGSAAGAIALAASPRDPIEQAARMAEVIARSPAPQPPVPHDVIEQAAAVAEAIEPALPIEPAPPIAAPPRSARKPKPATPAPRETDQNAILAALEHGSHTPTELAMVTALSGPSIRTNLSRLVSRGAVAKVSREGKIAYALASVSAPV
jgi:hypothetical protein